MYQPYMVAMSHLSDAQELLEHDPNQANRHINFAKWLLSVYREDMVSEFDATAEFKKFTDQGF